VKAHLGLAGMQEGIRRSPQSPTFCPVGAQVLALNDIATRPGWGRSVAYGGRDIPLEIPTLVLVKAIPF
jgi:hypothetical protein